MSDVARVMDAVRRVVRALRVSTRAVEREIGISGAQLFVLQQLGESPAESLNELAERTSTHQSSVSVVVSRLEEKGLVVREPAPEDARRVRIALAEEGRALLDRAPPTSQSQLVAGLRRLPPERLAVLAGAMEEWMREARLDTDPATFFFEEDERKGKQDDG